MSHVVGSSTTTPRGTLRSAGAMVGASSGAAPPAIDTAVEMQSALASIAAEPRTVGFMAKESAGHMDALFGLSKAGFVGIPHEHRVVMERPPRRELKKSAYADREKQIPDRFGPDPASFDGAAGNKIFRKSAVRTFPNVHLSDKDIFNQDTRKSQLGAAGSYERMLDGHAGVPTWSHW
eukprot:gnl/TRDRNA2_/TRDRNA2_193513_c0_seq1.p1 gnl/TRDRNA2_/TRDRNA2_193513_c0~~gnl/TRDRNA2_/TRDRNA2_193513_c0_seq1.p1  ORF type:complete len:202 (+),score=35.65 gnl/TRDRNA2_/TRDRNA2_193513_c0_seq1:74-607(+)